MTSKRLFLQLVNLAGNVINPRREDGHGAAQANPTHVTGSVTTDIEGYATEAKQDAINAALLSLISTHATETTLANALAELIAIRGKDFATEATLAAFKAAFEGRDLASEACQQDIKTSLSALGKETTLAAAVAWLSQIAGKDFATEATLSALKSDFNTTDFATEATLSNALAQLVLQTLDLEEIALGTSAAGDTIGNVHTVTSSAAIQVLAPRSGRNGAVLRTLRGEANARIYLGTSSGMSLPTGRPIDMGDALDRPYGPTIELWAKSDGPNVTLYVEELVR